MRRPVLWDSGAVCAFLNADDANHSAALDTARRIAAEGRTNFATNYLEVETHSLLLRRIGRDAALRWLFESEMPIERATAADEQRGREILARHRDKEWSLCDAISFAVVERRGGIAFSFDHHFRQYGRFPVWPQRR